VHKLEEELGGLLLRREHNLTHLTDFGRLVRPHLPGSRLHHRNAVLESLM
jgi:hypothetical protein